MDDNEVTALTAGPKNKGLSCLMLLALLCASAACSDDEKQTASRDDAGSIESASGGKAGSTPASGGRGGSAAGAAGAAAGTGGSATAGTGGAPEVIDDAGSAVEPTPIINVLSDTGHDRFYGAAYDTKGNLYAVGQISDSVDASADFSLLLVKFSPKGVLDASFGDKGVVRRNVVTGTNGELFRGVVVQQSGKIVVSGSVEHEGAADARDRDIAVLRFNPDGALDKTFGKDGLVALDLSTGVANGNGFSADSAWGLARYDDDRLLVSGGRVRDGGMDTDFALIRLLADGARDTGFGHDGVFTLDTKLDDGSSNNASPRNATLLPNDEGILGAGYQPVPGADTAPVVYKVTNDGELDMSFGKDGVFSERPLMEQTESYMAALQPMDGGGYKIVTTGYGRGLESETTDLVSLRLTSDGKLDTSYGSDGNGVARIDIGGYGDNSRRLAVLPDRRILLVGGGRLSAADVDGVVMVLTPDGRPDTKFSDTGWKTFDLGGPADFLWSLAFSPDKKTLALVGIKGVGMNAMPATANDDSAVLFLPVP